MSYNNIYVMLIYRYNSWNCTLY